MGPIGIAVTVVVVGGLVGLLMRALVAYGRRAGARGYQMVITAGTGAGQVRRIIAHVHDEVVLDRPWDVAPDDTSVLEMR